MSKKGKSKTPSGRGGANIRNLHTKVKTAKGRKLSSTLWLSRQLNDPYVQRAKAEGYVSRSAYKLIEINEKHQILKPGDRVIDLGAAPGGWCQVSAQLVGSTVDDPKVVGIDYLEMNPVAGCIILQKDFLDDDAPDMLLEALGDEKPDVYIDGKKYDHAIVDLLDNSMG